MHRQAGYFPRLLPVLASFALFWRPATGSGVEKLDFSAHIRPIISAKCFSCHGADEAARKAKLRLDLREEAVKERDGAFPIKPHEPDASELIKRVITIDAEEIMPPPKAGHALLPGEIALLRQWIAEGAEYTSHWAWAKPGLSPLPLAGDAGMASIDRFVADKLQAVGLKLSPLADKSTLARRVALDLTGLPPQPEVLAAYLKDESPAAYEAYVDSLLASPHFGERWAKVWLDLARYADSAGYGSDPLRLNIWPYRDWVIKAFNDNLSYEAFSRLQLAGDLMPEPAPEQLVATAFHRNTMTNTEGGTDDEEWRVAAVKDRAHVTAQVWMGLTMGCAQCHTHKFDPVSHREFYAFYALFNQTEDTDRGDDFPTLPWLAEEQKKRAAAFQTEVAALEANHARLPAPSVEELGVFHVFRSSLLVPPALVRLAESAQTIGEMKKELAGVKATSVPVLRPLAADKARLTKILNKGNYLDPGEPVSPGVPAFFGSLPAGQKPDRLAMVDWLFSQDNPLTARVAVNRFWAQLFGTGLVETEEDFGTQGQLPSHRELLDWLAVAFAAPKGSHENALGWDMKALLKLLVASHTYRQSSVVTMENLEKDPRARLLGRYPRRRLDAEQVRDQALALSGLLSPKMGGPSVYPPQPDGLWKAAFNGERSYATSTGEDRYRRGLYTIWRRSVPHPSMATFDAPSRETCTIRRTPTNTPLQAYVTLNDPTYVEAAQALARRLAKEGGTTTEERLRWGLKLVLSREPDPAAVAALLQLYEAEHTRFQGNPQDAEKLASDPLCPQQKSDHSAEAAALTIVANALLNLDGVLMKS